MESLGCAAAAVDDAGTPLSRGRIPQAGTSVVELLTSVLFVSILSVIAAGFARAALMSARVLEIKSESQEVTVMALDVLSRDIRAAGFSAAGTPFFGVTTATPILVAVAADLDGNGSTADPDELIAYSYDDTGHTLMRATGGASPQPLVSDVSSDGARFTFFDGAGMAVGGGNTPLTAEERRRIRRVDVSLRVALRNPDPNVSAPLTSAVSTSIALRNP